MPQWLNIDSTYLVWFGVASAVTFVGSLLIVPVLIVAMPADYFTRDRRRENVVPRHPVLRAVILVLKNTFGFTLVVAGAVMFFLPGQGLLTMMVGLVAMDFPGKYKLEKRVVGAGPVLRTMNWIRRRANRQPLLPPS